MIKFDGNEKKLLSVVKYTPPVFILIISVLLSIFLFKEYEKSVIAEKQEIKEQFINDGKDKIKSIVDISYEAIETLKEDSVKQLKKEIKNNVDNAYNVAYSIYNKYKNIKTEDEIKELIKASLRKIRFLENRGYFFIYSLNGINILHPELRDLENTNLWNYQDAKGAFLLQDMNKIMKTKSEAFYEWYWYKPNEEKKQYKKLGFFKKFEPYDWFIGTGEYLDDFNNKMKQYVLARVRKVSYSDDNYLFIINKEGFILSHKNLKLLGKNVHQNPSLKNLSSYIKNLEISKDDSFIEYKLNEKNTSSLEQSKISYLRYLDTWDWVIGTGFDLDYVNSMINKKQALLEEKYENYLKNSLIITLLLVIFLLIISQFLSNYIKEIFFKYKKETQHKEALLYQQSKMASMGEMLGNIAHQWRQPLSMISTCATGTKLQNEMGIITEKEINEGFDTINNTAQHLSQTIEDFRTYFNPKNNKESIFDVEKSIQKVLSLVKAQFLNNEITIVKNTTSVKIESLENELIQALVNILNNSRDALLENNINEKRYIFIDLYKKGNFIIIEIYDNAKGISKEIIQKVFEPYFTTKHQSHGTGIGLYMTQDIIVKLLDGKIEALNKEFIYKKTKYTGACFKITLNCD